MPTLSEDLAFRGLIHQMTDPRPARRRLDQPRAHRLRRLRPDGGQPARRQPAAALHAAPLPAGRPPAHLAGRRRHRHDRRPGRQADERQLLDPRDARAATSRASGPSWASSSTSDRRPTALLLDNADWLGTLSTLEFLRDVGKHFTVNQMVAKESVRTRFERRTRASPTPSSATCCCRPTTSCACTSTTAATSRSAAATSGATSPWASTSSARSAATRSGA